VGHDLICIGTSATMASEGSTEEQKSAVARSLRTLFGVPIYGRAGHWRDPGAGHARTRLHGRAVLQALRTRTIRRQHSAPEDYDALPSASSGVLDRVDVRGADGRRTDRLIRQAPRRLQGEVLEQPKECRSGVGGADRPPPVNSGRRCCSLFGDPAPRLAAGAASVPK